VKDEKQDRRKLCIAATVSKNQLFAGFLNQRGLSLSILEDAAANRQSIEEKEEAVPVFSRTACNESNHSIQYRLFYYVVAVA